MKCARVLAHSEAAPETTAIASGSYTISFYPTFNLTTLLRHDCMFNNLALVLNLSGSRIGKIHLEAHKCTRIAFVLNTCRSILGQCPTCLWQHNQIGFVHTHISDWDINCECAFMVFLTLIVFLIDAACWYLKNLMSSLENQRSFLCSKEMSSTTFISLLSEKDTRAPPWVDVPILDCDDWRGKSTRRFMMDGYVVINGSKGRTFCPLLMLVLLRLSTMTIEKIMQRCHQFLYTSREISLRLPGGS